MAAGLVGADGPRGGAVVPAARTDRARLVTALGSLAALGLVVADAAADGGRLGFLAVAAGTLGLGLLALGLLLRRQGTVPAAVLLAGAAYMVGREGRSVVDGRAAVVGVLLLLAAELASWSTEHDTRVTTEGDAVLARGLTLGALVLCALVVDLGLLAAAGVSGPSGVLLAALGVASAVAAIGLVLRLARR